MIELSPKVKRVIEDYMGNPISYGNESSALCYFRDWAIDQYKTPQLVCLRSDTRYSCCDRDKAMKHYVDYFAKEPRTYGIEFTPYSWVDYKTKLTNRNRLRQQCEKYFHDHIGDLATHACIARYGSVKAALLMTDTWIELWNDFEEWFQGKREKFMGKQKNEIEKVLSKTELTKKKLPQSHGGVANLLKVLTKTMEQQGADITSIAKVQYAVATQAGIYIPDEFLTDVAIALDATGEL